MFITAAYLIKKITSTPFTTFIRDNIFTPLNMTSTTYHPITDHSPTLSDSFVTLSNGTSIQIPYGFDFDEEGIEVASGAGGIVSSSRDMLKWLKFLITQVSLSQLNNISVLILFHRSNFSDKQHFHLCPSFHLKSLISSNRFSPRHH